MGNYNTLQPLQWDSEFFGMKIARIEVHNVHKNAELINKIIAESEYDLIYCFAANKSESVKNVQAKLVNAVWVDGKVTYVKDVMQIELDDTDAFRKINEMNDELYALAIQTGVYSRFNIDKNFKEGACHELYKKWIQNSVNRTIANEVYTYTENEKTQGMITIGEKMGKADIGLVGVDMAARGKGIATQLLKFAEKFAFENKYKQLQVVTQQQNEPACRLYEKYGFSIDSVVHIFHIWK